MAELPTLPPPLHCREQMQGPTPYSNWAIPGRVIAGAFPASLDDADTDLILTRLLELGVDTFVCLQAEFNVHAPEHAWRSGRALRPYVRDAQRLLSRAAASGDSRIRQRRIDFLHLAIVDGSVTTDTAMHRLTEDCCERVLRGEKLYVHCWGGHGRTGTLVATMLGRLYSLSASAALRHTQAYHDARVFPQGVRSPQAASQRAQVRRLLLMPSKAVPSVAAPGGASNGLPSSLSGAAMAAAAEAGACPPSAPLQAARPLSGAVGPRARHGPAAAGPRELLAGSPQSVSSGRDGPHAQPVAAVGTRQSATCVAAAGAQRHGARGLGLAPSLPRRMQQQRLAGAAAVPTSGSPGMAGAFPACGGGSLCSPLTAGGPSRLLLQQTGRLQAAARHLPSSKNISAPGSRDCMSGAQGERPP